MYDPDALTIHSYARRGPKEVFRVGLFVLSTIQQHLERVPLVMESFDRDGLNSRFLSAHRRYAVEVLSGQAGSLHQKLVSECSQYGATDEVARNFVRTFVELPGFGIVKAGFFAQLLLPGSNVGCLDRHNLRLAGLDEKTFVRTPTTAEGLTQKIDMYLAVCRSMGGSQALWNMWCVHLACLRPYSFRSADAVSKLHVRCIVGAKTMHLLPQRRYQGFTGCPRGP